MARYIQGTLQFFLEKMKHMSQIGEDSKQQRLNVDQNPLPFVIDVKKTDEYVESGSKNHSTWTSQSRSGLDKRQCTMQVVFRPEGN